MQDNFDAMKRTEKRDELTSISVKPEEYLFRRKEGEERSVLTLTNGLEIGGGHFLNMAGPCSIESYEQLYETAKHIKDCGATVLRGGAFKPRTSPYDFHGLGLEALAWMREIADELELLVVSEVMSEEMVEPMLDFVDIFQIGTRNAQNFSLLEKVGQTDKAILLKRGLSMTIDEWLMAAEYVLAAGNPNVILCERGIRTFEKSVRASLDISSIPVIKERTHLPIIVDPSHAAGESRYVSDLALAAFAARADGLIIEVHPDPKSALSDAKQQISFSQYSHLMEEIKHLAPVLQISLNQGQDAWL